MTEAVFLLPRSEAILPKSGLFNPKDHLKRSLHALHEPKKFIDSKIDYGVSGVYTNDQNKLVIKSKLLETDLGWALEQALNHRRPQIFFIDEAHHMLSVASGRKLTDVPEAIKSLANRTQVLHGLAGTYQLLALHDVGDQLSRRSVYIHLPRYNAEYIEDREIWQSVIWNFQCHLPIAEMPDLLGMWDYLYERSIGCVGTLKNWTRNALSDALDERATTITLKHLEARALSVGQARNILRHIKEGEKKYAELNWSKVINPLHLYKKTLSWCPICYHEWKQRNQTLYIPMMWLISEVKVCPIHHHILLKKTFQEC